MKINSSDNTSFQGRFLISRNIKNNRSNARFVEKIINFPIDGVTNKQLLDNRTYDVHIMRHSIAQTGKPKLGIFSSCFAFDLGYNMYKVKKNSEIAINQGISKAAMQLREHITKMDEIKGIHSGFNNFGESVKSCILMMIGIY